VEIEEQGVDAESFRPTGEFVTLGDIRVHFVSRGEGPAVILIHGNSGSHLDFPDELVSILSLKYRTILFDRPGHGFSDRPEDRVITVEHQANLLHAFVEKLGLESPVIVGHSWGGSLSLAFALLHPENYAGAVLIAPYAFGSEEDESTLDFFLGATLPTMPLVGDLAVKVLTPIFGDWMIEQGLIEAFSPGAVPEEYLASSKKLWSRETQVRAYAEDEKTINGSLAELSLKFEEINRPLVIIAGEKDALVPHQEHAVRLHQTVFHSKLILVPDTGHQIHQTHPDLVIDAVELVWEMINGAVGSL
jgi:pimeloyl-ACP methyl ester carboxylesterase